MKVLVLFCVVLALSESSHVFPKVKKAVDTKVYAHLMPWFETKESDNSSVWGQHWTMATKNPDIILDDTGKREIAAYYYPEIGPYASADPDTIEYQLLLMKYSGIDGILLDWPGTTVAWDYPKNKQNSEAIIAGCEKFGLDFAIVYEDHNIGMAHDAGFITDRFAQAQADMIYLRDRYFTSPRYVQVNGQPLLLDFGPQTFGTNTDWFTIFEPFGENIPTFLTLWNQIQQAEGSAAGEYAWIYVSYMDGLQNFYNNRPLNVKIGVAYPGFKGFYLEGGWGSGPGWTIDVGLDTFAATFDLAIDANISSIQLATWNDYGEATMVEPTREFGNSFLNHIQKKQGLIYGDEELELVKTLHRKRLEYKNDATRKIDLDFASNLLINLKPQEAAQVLKSIK